MFVAPSPKLTATTRSAFCARAASARPDADRDAGTDDAGGDHETDIGICDVHGAALAAAGPRLAPQHLAENLDQGHPLADQVVQTPVRRHQAVVAPQAGREPGGDRFLTPGRPIDGEELPGPYALAQALVASLGEGHDLEHLSLFLGRRLEVDRCHVHSLTQKSFELLRDSNFWFLIPIRK